MGCAIERNPSCVLYVRVPLIFMVGFFLLYPHRVRALHGSWMTPKPSRGRKSKARSALTSAAKLGAHTRVRAISHTEAAHALGCSASNVRRLIASGALATDVVRGERRLTQESVERYQSERAGAVDGTLTARVFSLLMKGHELVEVTVSCKLSPERALRLAHAYQAIRALGALDVSASAPGLGSQLCARCGVDPARYCAGCAAPEPPTKEPSSPPERVAESAPRR